MSEPWTVFQNRHPESDGRSWGVIEARRHPFGGAGQMPAGMTITWHGAEGRENAEMIVRAVNAHEELVDALDLAREFIAGAPHPAMGWQRDVLAKIDAALAKARGV